MYFFAHRTVLVLFCTQNCFGYNLVKFVFVNKVYCQTQKGGWGCLRGRQKFSILNLNTEVGGITSQHSENTMKIRVVALVMPPNADNFCKQLTLMRPNKMLFVI